MKLVVSGQWWPRSRESAQCNEAEASPYRRCHPFRCGLDACSLWWQHSRPVIVFRIRIRLCDRRTHPVGHVRRGLQQRPEGRVGKGNHPCLREGQPRNHHQVRRHALRRPQAEAHDRRRGRGAARPDPYRPRLERTVRQAGCPQAARRQHAELRGLGVQGLPGPAWHDPVQRSPLRPAPGHEHARAHLQPRCPR